MFISRSIQRKDTKGKIRARGAAVPASEQPRTLEARKKSERNGINPAP